MVTAAEEDYLLHRAYVPEHVAGLMTAISGGEPFLLHDYLVLAGDNWLVVVGYPLGGGGTAEPLDGFLQEATARFRKPHLLVMAPQLPERLRYELVERESDQYYRLDVAGFAPKARFIREAERARDALTVEATNRFAAEHRSLIAEFLKREQPGPGIAELYRGMERYAGKSPTSVLLEARTRLGRLAAFFVVERAAEQFDAYVVGCHSKSTYVPHASDLLLVELVGLARRAGKEFIHLGLGVNAGIRRFKEKWGGVPWLAYEFCEWRTGEAVRSPLFSVLESIR